jgi:hypothetical protein
MRGGKYAYEETDHNMIPYREPRDEEDRKRIESIIDKNKNDVVDLLEKHEFIDDDYKDNIFGENGLISAMRKDFKEKENTPHIKRNHALVERVAKRNKIERNFMKKGSYNDLYWDLLFLYGYPPDESSEA